MHYVPMKSLALICIFFSTALLCLEKAEAQFFSLKSALQKKSICPPPLSAGYCQKNSAAKHKNGIEIPPYLARWPQGTKNREVLDNRLARQQAYQKLRSFINHTNATTSIRRVNVDLKSPLNISIIESELPRWSHSVISPQFTPFKKKNIRQLKAVKAAKRKINKEFFLSPASLLNRLESEKVDSSRDLTLNVLNYNDINKVEVSHAIGKHLAKNSDCTKATLFLKSDSPEMFKCMQTLGIPLASLLIILQSKKINKEHDLQLVNLWLKYQNQLWREDGAEIMKDVDHKKINSQQIDNFYFSQTLLALRDQDFKTAKSFAQKIQKSSNHATEARLILEILNKNKVNHPITEKHQKNLSESKRGIAHLKNAIAAVSTKNYTKAILDLKKTNNKDPEWIQSLIHTGWLQLLNNDPFGAIGNMHSLQNPTFSSIYMPESHVIRTIGYLGICQYGDAYRSLTELEKIYRPMHQSISKLLKTKKVTTHIKNHFFASSRSRTMKQKDSKLAKPVQIEIRRTKEALIASKKFLSSQKQYKKIDALLLRWQKFHEELFVKEKNSYSRALQKQFVTNRLKLNRKFIQLIQSHITQTKKKQMNIAIVAMESRLKEIHKELSLLLDNNEVLRFEVYAASGENLRALDSNSLKNKRVHRDIMPSKKSLNWTVSQELWLDEVGNYRSSLKNNCAHSIAQKKEL